VYYRHARGKENLLIIRDRRPGVHIRTRRSFVALAVAV
jgi:hypothetical protein